MKNLLLAAALALAPAAHAETWQCTNSQTGNKYVVSQMVPGDVCKLVSSTANPHIKEPESLRPSPRPSTAGACDKASAFEAQRLIREFAKWHMEGSHLAVHWQYAIDKEPTEKRLKMMTTFADMDACLRGSAFEIMFYRKGKVMGTASPNSGIQLVK